MISGELTREEWLKPLSRKDLQELATCVFPDSKLDAWTVPKLSAGLTIRNEYFVVSCLRFLGLTNIIRQGSLFLKLNF